MDKQRGEPSDGALVSFAGQDELAGAFADFARSAQQQADPDSTLARLLRHTALYVDVDEPAGPLVGSPDLSSRPAAPPSVRTSCPSTCT